MYPHEISDLYRLMRNQWRPPASLRELQERKFLTLVHHAYQNVPYYRRLFDSVNLKPADIRGLRDLEKIPMTSKADLLGPPLEDVMAKGMAPEDCREAITSGATGMPFRVYYRRKDSTILSLGWVRTYLIHGTKPWDKIVGFSGWRVADSKMPWYERLGIWRRKTLSALDSPDQWIAELRRWNPQVVTGYCMTLNLLASALKERPCDSIRPKVVLHTSALLHDYDRQLIGEALHAKVVDIYGSHEGGCIAWECPQCSGYHINLDLVVLEIIKDGRAAPRGEDGEIVITNLHSHAMPLIRYRQRDIASLSPEEPTCGRGMPLMRNIQGRIDDHIVLPSGTRLSSHPFYWALVLVRGVRQWRVIQEEKDLLRVEVVAGKEWDSRVPSSIETNLRTIVHDEMRIAIALVDRIDISPAQKFRSVISHIKTADSA